MISIPAISLILALFWLLSVEFSAFVDGTPAAGQHCGDEGN